MAHRGRPVRKKRVGLVKVAYDVRALVLAEQKPEDQKQKPRR